VLNLKLARALLTSSVTIFSEFLACGSGSPAAAALTLAWDPSTEPSVSGYRLYQGGQSQVYTNILDIGQQTTLTISNLAPSASYYFAVTAYDDSGLESAFSGEINYTVPASLTQPPNLLGLSFAQTPLNPVVLTGTGPAGAIYEVEATQDYSSWLLIGSVTVDGTGSFEFTDPQSLVLPIRFYRLRQTTTQPATANPLSVNPTTSP
jgi:hypothetical protein